MKFTLQSVPGFGRLGIISNVARLKGFEMATPHVLLFTQSGTVPHLTHEVLQWVSNKQLGLNIPVQSVEHLQDQMKIYKNSIADFIGMKEYLTYCSYINPLEKQTHRPSKKNSVGVWTRQGRKYFTADSYMELVNDLKPDMFVLLADGDTDLQSSQKRTKTSFSNSQTFFEKCQEIFEKSPGLKFSQVLGALQGGSNLILREEASKFIGDSSVFGVVIDGLHDCSETVSEVAVQDVKSLIEASLKHISKEKLRVIHGCWNPYALLELVELGIDMFDSSYLTSVTDQGGAFIFPNTSNLLEEYQHSVSGDEGTKNDVSNLVESEGPKSKKIKLGKSKFYILMDDPSYLLDFNPILENCTCLACENHTRAYVHHLVTVKELLGPTLLMIHNLHHYLVFLSTIREAIRYGKFPELKKQFQNWFDSFNPSL